MSATASTSETSTPASAEPLVTPIEGEPLRFRVASRSRRHVWFIVDVEENACSCEQHEFRIAPALSRGEYVPRCFHLRAARNYLLDKMIAQLSKQIGVGR